MRPFGSLSWLTAIRGCGESLAIAVHSGWLTPVGNARAPPHLIA